MTTGDLKQVKVLREVSTVKITIGLALVEECVTNVITLHPPDPPSSSQSPSLTSKFRPSLYFLGSPGTPAD